MSPHPLAGPRPRAFIFPRAGFWRTAVMFAIAVAALCALASVVRADEDPWSAQAFFRQEAAQARQAPDAFETVGRIGRFAHHVLAPALIDGERVVREVRGAATDVVREAARCLRHGNMTGTRGPWCADFTSYVLARTGHHTVRSRLARDAVRAGRPIRGRCRARLCRCRTTPASSSASSRPAASCFSPAITATHVGLGVYSTHGARFALPA